MIMYIGYMKRRVWVDFLLFFIIFYLFLLFLFIKWLLPRIDLRPVVHSGGAEDCQVHDRNVHPIHVPWCHAWNYTSGVFILLVIPKVLA